MERTGAVRAGPVRAGPVRRQLDRVWLLMCWAAVGLTVAALPALALPSSAAAFHKTVVSAAVGALVVAACLRASAAAALPAATRQLWRALTVVVVLLSAGVLIGTNGAEHGVATAIVLYQAALLVLSWALVRLPVAGRTRAEWVTAALDGGVLVSTIALFGWHFRVREAVLAGSGADVLPLATALTHCVVAVVLAIRMCLDWDRTALRRSLHLLGGGVVVSLVVQVTDPLMTGGGVLGRLTFVLAPLSCACWVWAAAAAVRYGPEVQSPPVPTGRGFSALPCVAVIATCGLLFAAGPTSSAESRIVVAGSIVVVLLVLVRQMLVLADNDRLIRRVVAGRLDLRRNEDRFHTLLRNTSDIVLVTTADGTLRYASPTLQDLIGVPVDHVVGRSLTEYVHPDDRPAVADASARVRREPLAEVTYRIRALRPDGARWLELFSRNLLEDGVVRGIVTTARDVSEAQRYQEQLEYQRTHDKLTGLLNRSTFLAWVERALAAQPGFTSIAVLDIDGFRTITDRFGAGVGDDVLIAVGNALARHAAPDSAVARLGDDEYALLLHGGPVDNDVAVARLMEAVVEPLTALGHDLLVQFTAGTAHGHHGVRAAELLRRADVALSAAQELGHTGHATWTAEQDRHMIEYAHIGAGLRRALDAGDQLHLVYQPIVTVPDGDLAGVEALIRWEHPELGPMAPDEFIPAAERNGLIVPIGRWVLRTACEQAVAWAAPLTISVNVSARQLRETGLVQDVADVLADTGLDPHRLTVEVTETAVFDNDRAVQALRRLHDMGVRIALDDFGTGHSSLTLLRTCPVDIIKVDKSFIDDVTGTPQQAAIAVSLIHIARTTGLIAIAEGVETAAQADTLERLGYQYAQGYHFARPMPASAVTALADRHADALH